jgi:hypothetical protein
MSIHDTSKDAASIIWNRSLYVLSAQGGKSNHRMQKDGTDNQDTEIRRRGAGAPPAPPNSPPPARIHRDTTEECPRERRSCLALHFAYPNCEAPVCFQGTRRSARQDKRRA